MRLHLLRSVSVVLCILFVSGCSTYRVTVTQGNMVKPDRLAQLETGMTPEQVEYLLGTPLLRSAIAPERWDYVFKIQRGSDVLRERRVTVFFKDGVVANVEDTNPLKQADSIETLNAEATRS